MFNDVMPHTETNSNGSMHLEIKAMAYACSSVPALANAIYVDFKINSYNTSPINNMRVSFRNDVDLGFAFDDYIGCDTLRRMGICYNGDNNDEGVMGYGANLTQTACILLKSPTDSNGYKAPLGGFIYYNNDMTATGNPYNAQEYISYMNNKWKDGLPFTTACDGRSAGSAINYIFPDDPSVAGGKSEKVCGNTPNDRRFLLNSESFNWAPGDKEIDFNIAFVDTPIGSSNLDFTALKAYADTVIQYADGCSSSFPLSTNSISTLGGIQLFPNPAVNTIDIKCDEVVWQKISSIEIYSADGKRMGEPINDSNINHTINVENFASGLYFIKLISNDKIYTNRFLKQ